MTFSVVFLILGLITLLIGWNAGSDPVLWVSIASTVLAGVLLAVSYLQERRMRLQTEPAGGGYEARSAPPPAPMPEASVISEAEEPEMARMDSAMGEEEEEEEMVPARRPSRSTTRRAPSKPKAKSAAKSKAKTAAKPKTRTSAAAKTSAAKAKAKPKAKPPTRRKSTRSS